MLCLPQAMRYPPTAYQKDFESVEVCLCATCMCMSEFHGGRTHMSSMHCVCESGGSVNCIGYWVIISAQHTCMGIHDDDSMIVS